MVERARYEPVYGHRDGWPIGPCTNVKQKQKEEQTEEKRNKNTVMSQFMDTAMDGPLPLALQVQMLKTKQKKKQKHCYVML